MNRFKKSLSPTERASLTFGVWDSGKGKIYRQINNQDKPIKITKIKNVVVKDSMEKFKTEMDSLKKRAEEMHIND